MDRTLPEELKNVLDSIILMVKYIKKSKCSTDTLNDMCHDIEPTHETRMLHTNICWMSIGKMFTRLYEQREKLLNIFSQEAPRFPIQIKNSACASVPGSEENIITWNDKLNEFMKKIALWKKQIALNDFTMFPIIAAVNTDVIFCLIMEHLSALEKELPRYLPSFDLKEYIWVQDPFAITANDIIHMKLKAAEELIELRNIVRPHFPVLAENAISTLLHFSPTSILALKISTLLNITNNEEALRCSIEDKLRVYLSTIKSSIESLETKQLVFAFKLLRRNRRYLNINHFCDSNDIDQTINYYFTET
nr:PREDICTED: protein FAM200A-like [Megachile rotundata]